MKRLFLGIALLGAIGGCSPVVSQSSPSPAQVANSSSPAAVQAAPTPKANDQSGAPVDFAALYQKGPVLVYFYPKADTPGCTAQACSLRDSYQKLTDAGLTVIGVSTDDAAAQKEFQAKYNLPFILIPDTEKVVLNAFGVNSTLGMASREAFLIREGKIVWHDDSASTSKQADDVIAEMANWKK